MQFVFLMVLSLILCQIVWCLLSSRIKGSCKIFAWLNRIFPLCSLFLRIDLTPWGHGKLFVKQIMAISVLCHIFARVQVLVQNDDEKIYTITSFHKSIADASIFISTIMFLTFRWKEPPFSTSGSIPCRNSTGNVILLKCCRTATSIFCIDYPMRRWRNNNVFANLVFLYHVGSDIIMVIRCWNVKLSSFVGYVPLFYGFK